MGITPMPPPPRGSPAGDFLLFGVFGPRDQSHRPRPRLAAASDMFVRQADRLQAVAGNRNVRLAVPGDVQVRCGQL